MDYHTYLLFTCALTPSESVAYIFPAKSVGRGEKLWAETLLAELVFYPFVAVNGCQFQRPKILQTPIARLVVEQEPARAVHALPAAQRVPVPAGVVHAEEVCCG